MLAARFCEDFAETMARRVLEADAVATLYAVATGPAGSLPVRCVRRSPSGAPTSSNGSISARPSASCPMRISSVKGILPRLRE